MVRGRIALTLLLGLGLLAPAGAAAPTRPQQDDRLELGAVNYIRAAASSKVRVHIPQRAGVTFELLESNRDLRAEGRGRFVGIVLTKQPVFEQETLIGGLVRKCSRRGCTGVKRHLTHPMRMGTRRMVHFSPGNYVLYVIADGSPVEVRLLLHGLEGTTWVRPTTAADVTIDSLPVVVGGPAPIPAQVTGATIQLDRPALVFDTLWFEGNPSGITDIGTCLYEGEPESDAAVAYSTLCGEMGAEERGATRITPGGIGFSELLLVFDVPLAAGSWGAGTHLSCTCVLSDSGTWRVVLQR